MRPSGRAPDQMRAIVMEPGFTRHAEGSCLISFGDTRVLVTASVEFGLMTKFTSFVAVEERIVNQNGKPVKMEVPVEAPSGVDMTKAGGRWGDPNSKFTGVSNGAGRGGGIGTGSGTGSGSGSGSGYGSGSASLPVQSRQVSSLPAMSADAATAQIVTVTSEIPTINMSDSSVSTTIRPDSNGNMRVGGGGGGGKNDRSRKSKSTGAMASQTKAPLSPPSPTATFE